MNTDIKECVCCERNLRIYNCLLYCKPCNFIYFIDTDKTPLTSEESKIENGESGYPETFKDPERTFTCCRFIGYTTECCDESDSIDTSSTSKGLKLYTSSGEPLYLDLDAMVCGNELLGCFYGANTTYWKNSKGQLITFCL